MLHCACSGIWQHMSTLAGSRILSFGRNLSQLLQPSRPFAMQSSVFPSVAAPSNNLLHKLEQAMAMDGAMEATALKAGHDHNIMPARMESALHMHMVAMELFVCTCKLKHAHIYSSIHKPAHTHIHKHTTIYTSTSYMSTNFTLHYQPGSLLVKFS